MDQVDAFIRSVLSHGESRYDPVKAHEYYLRTRELKGQRSTANLRGKVKKEAWAYTKNQVEQERTQSQKGAAEAHRQAVAQLHDRAKQRGEEIRVKLKQLMDSLSGKEGEVQAKIDALPEIPKGISKEERAQLVAERKDEIASIRGEGQAKRQQAQGAAKAGREAIHAELTSSLEKAKQAYTAAREGLKAKYEAELNKEYNSIRENV